MTPAEYAAAIKALGLTHDEAARFLGVHAVTSRTWAAEMRRRGPYNGPPAPVAKFLRLMLVLKFTPAYVDDVTR
jgi:hypothetical protein